MAACVCELTEPLGLTQPTISHHLKILVHAGIFTRDKRGVWSHCSLVSRSHGRPACCAQHHTLSQESLMRSTSPRPRRSKAWAATATPGPRSVPGSASPARPHSGDGDGEGDDNSGRACAQQGEDDAALQQQEQEQDQASAEDGVLPGMAECAGERDGRAEDGGDGSWPGAVEEGLRPVGAADEVEPGGAEQDEREGRRG